VWGELAREYRRLAHEATARGDHRRAAYLYGVLLRDLRAAANALMAGGLFRDAALILRDKIGDEFAAASAYEQAGDYDEAVRLFEKLGQYQRAGDLLRRLGDDARADEFFTRAADVLAQTRQWVAAGDLIRTKVGDRTRAASYYRAGWRAGVAESVPCAERLLDEHLVAEEWGEVRALFDDAAARLTPPQTRDAGRFFNYVLKVGERVLLPDLRDDLTDRIRLLFAAHLRANGGGAGALVNELFAREPHWPGPVVRDAAFSSRAPARKPAAPALTHEPAVRLADGVVTAVGVARDTGDVVVATASSPVFWQVGEGRILPFFPAAERGIFALSVSAPGGVVYALHYESDSDSLLLRCFLAPGRSGSFRPMGSVRLGADEHGAHAYLQPTPSIRGGEYTVTLASPRRTTYRGPHLLPQPPDLFWADGGYPTHLLVDDDNCAWEWAGRSITCRAERGSSGDAGWPVPWVPGLPEGCSLAAPRVDWITPTRRVLEITGVEDHGALYWSEFDARGNEPHRSKTVSAAHPDRFLAACLIAPGAVAAVTGQNEVHWLRVSGGPRFRAWAPPRRLAVPARAVALVSRPHANEVVAVLDDGSAVRVPKP
jgi:hypothetical protein